MLYSRRAHYTRSLMDHILCWMVSSFSSSAPSVPSVGTSIPANGSVCILLPLSDGLD